MDQQCCPGDHPETTQRPPRDHPETTRRPPGNKLQVVSRRFQPGQNCWSTRYTIIMILLQFGIQYACKTLFQQKLLEIPTFIENVFAFLKDVHIVVPFAYLSSSYSKFEWAENTAVQTRTKKLCGKQICCTTKGFL